jgi:hypothetical protein
VGGLRGDIPLEATGGELIAGIVVETGRSLILDISQFSLGDRKKFATAFGEKLWQRKKAESHPSPIMLVIEESQLIVPERATSETARMLGIYEEIIRLGRNYGIGCTMISQRPQSVNKEVLNQTECLFVGQVNGSQERDALKKWIAYQGMSQDLVNELPSLTIGTMYVWSPQWLNILEKVKIAKKTTYDASATPKVGEKREARELKPLNMDELKQAMAATIERAKADDPKELKRKIAELQRQLHSKNPVVDESAINRAVQQAVSTVEKGYREQAQKLTQQLSRMQNAFASIAKQSAGFADIDIPLAKIEIPARTITAPQRQPSIRPAPTRKQRDNNADTSELSGPERRILNAIAWLNSIGVADPQLTAVAFLAGYTIGGGAFNNPKSSLRTKGLIEYAGDRIRLTREGESLAEVPDTPLDAAELQRMVLERLPGPERKILSVLLENPQGVENETLAELSGYTAGGGAFNNPKGRLRSLGLIDYRSGLVVPEPLLFLEGA